MRPTRDPASTKYPDRTFFAGAWRTPGQIERRRVGIREVDSRRIQVKAGGIRLNYPVRSEMKGELQARLAVFRKNQSRTKGGT